MRRHTFLLIILAGWAWAVAALPQITNAGWELGWSAVLLVTGGLVAGGWLWQTARHPEVVGFGRRRWGWLSVPAAGAAVLALGMTDYGLALRLRFCEGEVRAFADAARAGKEDVGASGPNECRVGLFFVHRTFGFGSEVHLITAQGLGQSYGLAYWPDGPPTGSGDEYRPLFGPWYRYYDDF